MLSSLNTVDRVVHYPCGTGADNATMNSTLNPSLQKRRHARSDTSRRLAQRRSRLPGLGDGSRAAGLPGLHGHQGARNGRRVLPTWLAFSDQSNPQWIEQDSSVWPIQSFQWSDPTLRRIERNLRDKLASGTIHALADGPDSGDPSGLLKLDSSWQDAHFAPDRPRSPWDYFLDHAPQPVT